MPFFYLQVPRKTLPNGNTTKGISVSGVREENSRPKWCKVIDSSRKIERYISTVPEKCTFAKISVHTFKY